LAFGVVNGNNMKQSKAVNIVAIAGGLAVGVFLLSGFPPQRMKAHSPLASTLARAMLDGIAVDEYVVGRSDSSEHLYRMTLTPEEFDRLCSVTNATAVSGASTPTKWFPYWWPKSQTPTQAVFATQHFDAAILVLGEHYQMVYDESTHQCYVTVIVTS
jgi:hypothetical protein